MSCLVFWAQLTYPFLQGDLRDVSWKNYSCINNLLQTCYGPSIVTGSWGFSVVSETKQVLGCLVTPECLLQRELAMQTPGKRAFQAEDSNGKEHRVEM